MYCPPRQSLFPEAKPRKIVVVEGGNTFAIVRNTQSIHSITVLLYRCKLNILKYTAARLLCHVSRVARLGRPMHAEHVTLPVAN
jgi:hypothetical protein